MRPESPSDPTPRRVALPRGEASLTDEGEGPVVVAVHGLPGSVADFRWLAPALRGLRLIRLDMPGFGDTPAEAPHGHSAGGWADYVLRVLDALGVGRAAVLGHSFGGHVALRLGARHPDRVTAVALLATAGARPHRAYRYAPLVLGSHALRKPLLRPVFEQVARASFAAAGFPRSLSTATITEAVHTFARVDFPAAAEDAAALRVPTLLAWATDDALVQPAIPAELSGRLPDGPRLVFDDGGHNIQKTRAVEIGAALSAWIPEVLP